MTVKQLIAQLSELPQNYEINLCIPIIKNERIVPLWSMLEEIKIDSDMCEVELYGE